LALSNFFGSLLHVVTRPPTPAPTMPLAPDSAEALALRDAFWEKSAAAGGKDTDPAAIAALKAAKEA
jgi:hypothetical protein